MFVFDANVLLNLYRYTEGTRLKFLDLIPHLKERVWLPHQAALEFQRGRPGVILEQEAIYEQVEADLKKTAERIRERVEAIRREDEGHPLLAIAMTCNGLAAKARKHKDDHPNLLEHDPVVEAHLAITLIKHRLRNSYGDDVEFKVVGEPVTLSGAEQLAQDDRHQFEWWALGLVGARPQEQKRGADQGIDGRLYFHDQPGGKTKQVILSVKSGSTGVAHVRDLRGVVDREKAEIGALITLQEPTGPMRKEALSSGFYDSPWGKHPKLQILTVEELLNGAEIDYPPITGGNVTYKKAPKYRRVVAEQLDLT